MPHLIIEYSANIEDRIDLPGLIDKLHNAAAETGVFPLKGIRTRAARREYYRIADGHADNGFVHVVTRIRHGRPMDVRKKACATLFDVLCTHLEDHYDNAPIGISFEMQEIDPVLSFKKNNLNEYIEARARESAHE